MHLMVQFLRIFQIQTLKILASSTWCILKQDTCWSRNHAWRIYGDASVNRDVTEALWCLTSLRRQTGQWTVTLLKQQWCLTRLRRRVSEPWRRWSSGTTVEHVSTRACRASSSPCLLLTGRRQSWSSSTESVSPQRVVPRTSGSRPLWGAGSRTCRGGWWSRRVRSRTGAGRSRGTVRSASSESSHSVGRWSLCSSPAVGCGTVREAGCSGKRRR